MPPVASRDRDVESRLALKKMPFFGEPQATQSVVSDACGCRLGILQGPYYRRTLLFDDVFAGVAAVLEDAAQFTQRVHLDLAYAFAGDA